MTVFKSNTWMCLLQCVVIALVGWGIGLYFWGDLPEPMPVHWDGAGNPDGFAPRWLGISFGPLTSLLIPLVILFVTRFDPRRDHVDRSAKHLETIVLGTSIFGLVIQAITLHAAMSEEMTLDPTWIMVLVGGLFIVIGNALPKFGSNFFIGIRTPWTLSSEKVWHKTQRLGGILFVLGGFAMMLLPFLGFTGNLLVGAILAISFGAALIPAGYSWWIYQQEARG